MWKSMGKPLESMRYPRETKKTYTRLVTMPFNSSLLGIAA